MSSNEYIIGGAVGLAQIIVGHPFDTIKTIIQTNNKIKINYKIPRLYNGLAYPLIGSILTNSIVFGLNKELYKTTSNYWVSGFFTGMISSIIINPIDVYKIREQTLTNNRVNLFRGLPVTCLRESIAFSIYFGSYFNLKKNDISPSISGGISGWLCWLCTYPIDVIKTRLQINSSLTIVKAYKQGALWRGFKICTARSILINSVGFTLYEKLNS